MAHSLITNDVAADERAAVRRSIETFPDVVLRAIGERQMTPKPAWRFFFKNALAWSVTAGSTALVGTTLSVIVFMLTEKDWEVVSYLDRSIAKQAIISAPYIWLAAYLALALGAHYSFRSTRNGYHYETKRLVATGLVTSGVVGALLMSVGAGQNVHAALLKSVPAYENLVYTNQDLWANPNRGLLAGTVLQANDKQVVVADRSGATWVVTADAAQVARLNMAPGGVVKMVGAIAGPNKFEASQLRSWDE